MKPKTLGILIAFLVWTAGSTYWYVCKIKGFCAQPAVETAAPVEKTDTEQTGERAEKAEQHDLIYYQKNSEKPLINDMGEWKAEVKSLAQLKAEGKKLKIEAPYYADEQNPTAYDNLGLARAESLKKLMAPEIDTALVITSGKLLQGAAPAYIDGYQNYIRSINDNAFVKERKGKTLIYFPVNSTREIRNPQINNYLDELALTLQKSPELQVAITGYTDNTGSAKHNLSLGLQRAKRIQNVLIKKGIEPNRINVKSEGANHPIASNDTPEGRQQNRRVEIIIIQK